MENNPDIHKYEEDKMASFTVKYFLFVKFRTDSSAPACVRCELMTKLVLFGAW